MSQGKSRGRSVEAKVSTHNATGYRRGCRCDDKTDEWTDTARGRLVPMPEFLD